MGITKLSNINRKFILIIIFSFICVSLYSLGAFSLFNGRNRADLKWFEVKTEQVRVVYNDGLQETALRAIAIADSTYNVLIKTFDIIPSKEILIFLSDQDDITNGAALLDHYIFIWADSNDFVKMFTGDQKWLEKVIPHELVHWFVMYTLNDWLSMFLPISQLKFPMELHEGYAMFFSGEPWGLNRGDKFLRTYSFSRNQGSSNAYWEGNFMYASGFAFVKYLSEFYGEEKLIKLIKSRDKWKLFNFSEAFKEVYKKSFEDIWEEWSRYINTWYFGETYVQKLMHTDTFSEVLSVNSITTLKTNMQVLDFVIKTDQILAAVRLSENQRFTSLIHGSLNADSLAVDKFHIDNWRVIENAGWFNEADISPNGRYVVFTRVTRHKYGRLAPLVTLYDTETRKKIRLGEGAFPVVNDEGLVYYQHKTEKVNSIISRNIQGNKEVFLALTPDNQIVDLRLSPDGKYLSATIFDPDRDFLIAIFETNSSINNETVILNSLNNLDNISFINEPIEILQLHSMPQDVLWMNDKNLSIMMENENIFKLELYLYNIETEEFRFFETPPYNIFPRILVEHEEGLQAISLNEVDRGSDVIGKAYLPEKRDFDNRVTVDPVHYYNRWIYREPANKIPDLIVPYNNLIESKYSPLKNISYRTGFALPTSMGVVGTVLFSEPLGKHLFQAAGFYPLWHKESDPYWMMTYENNAFRPSISMTAINTNWIAGVHNEDIIYNKLNLYSLSALFRQDFRYQSFSHLYYHASLSYYNFRLLERSKEFSDMFTENDIVTAELGTYYYYDLPWMNSIYHPVRSLDIELSYEFSDENLGMLRNYWQIKAFTDFSYAPLLNMSKNEIIKTIALQNRTHYRLAGGEPFSQFLPGVDDSEFFYFGGQPMFSRLYLRGFNQMMWGKELFNTQTDLKIKLLDDLDFSLNWGIPLLRAGYLGVSGWYDYTRLSQHVVVRETEEVLSEKNKTFEAMGYEIRSAWEIMGMPTLHRFGQAFDKKGNKLDYYYIFEIPFFHF